MMEEAPDIASRLKALDTRRSFILEAPAGSGKTALLTARFLALLAEVRHPRQILAVTFTRKAAAEMAERVMSTLREAHEEKNRASDDPWENRLLDLGRRALKAHAEQVELMWSPEAFQVNTFHGFCASIGRGWPLEARVPPHFELLNDPDQQALLKASVDRYLQSLTAETASVHEKECLQRRLAAANNNVKMLSNQLLDLLRRRDRLEAFLHLFQHSRFQDEMEQRVERLAGLTLGRLRAYFKARREIWLSLKKNLVVEQAGMADKLPADIPGDKVKDIMAWQEAAKVFLTKSKTPRQSFRGPGFPAKFKNTELARFISEIPGDAADDFASVANWPRPDQENVGIDALADMLTLAGGALQVFRSLMSERGLDFLELEIAALRALGQFDRPSESLIFFHEHLRHILVDEAQDVNDTQVRILSALTEGWGQPGDNRTVFMVGDPKQSIYRFRRAEVSLFEDLRTKGLPRTGEARLPLEPLTLTSNFRSRPLLVDFANRLFARVMAEPDKDYDEVDFALSQAARENADTPDPVTGAFFHYRLASNKQLQFPLKTEARRQEAKYVAGLAAQRHAENPDATAAILIPARTHLSYYVKALEALGLPVKLMEGVPMLNRAEVRHLLNLFKALLRPYDDVAWAGVLRAPWSWVSNRVLERLAGRLDEKLWSEKIRAGRNLDPAIARFLDAYDKIRPDFGRAPYAESLKHLWEELNGPGVVVRMWGSAALANAMDFFRIVGQCPDGGGEETLDYLNRLLENEYTPPDPRAAFSPVSMMTIHRAKGLEFDHVYAVGLDYDALSHRGNRNQTPAFLMDRLPGPDRIYLASATADRRTGTRNLACAFLEDLEKKRCLAEQKRLFYVVATRARESLTMTGLFHKKSDTKQEGNRHCPVDWLWRANKAECFKGASFDLLENPEPPLIKPVTVSPERDLITPSPFTPEPLPYIIQSPSKVEGETATAVRTGAEEIELEARAKGVVMHRIFETLARRERLPDKRAVAAALGAEGIAQDEAMKQAPRVLLECERAWQFEPFRKLRDGALEIVTEWAVEDFSKTRILRVGRIDLLLKTSEGSVIVDFKTGKPDGNPEAWLDAEVQRYSPQLKAYREMAAKVAEEKLSRVRAVLFFTSVLKWLFVV